MPPTISGYVIAKDEEATIERTLQSLRGVCGEVIAGVDDASTDRTESICHEYADQVVRFTWSDDFSAARNQVVDACTGDWIVHLDGHEHFAVQQQPHPDAVFVLGEEAARMGKRVAYERFPIPDLSIPTKPEMTGILDAIDVALDADENVYLHCHAGIGRTGMTVGCYLVRRGMTGAHALVEIARLRDGLGYRSPETPEQISFVRGWTRCDVDMGYLS